MIFVIKNTQPYILLFGDRIEDTRMVLPEDHKNTILIGFYDENKNDTKKYQDGLEMFKNAYDVVCTDDTSFNELFDVLGLKFLLNVQV